MTRWLLAIALIGGCKDKPSQNKLAPPPPPPSDASRFTTDHPELPADAAPPVAGVWATCKAGLEKAASAPATRRVETILAACTPCGNWAPILGWQRMQEDGGPNRKDIEQAMAGCKAWCTPNAKVRFMGTLDDARAKKSRTPWRELASQCKDAVSAVPDGRYVNAPYFALDRIARWAGEQEGGAKLLEAIDLPLPAVTQTGVGVKLADAPLVKPELPPAQITMTAAGLTAGPMPRAKLTPAGVVPQGEPYPGAPVDLKTVEKTLEKLGKAAVFASPELPASKVYELLRAARTTFVLAAASSLGPAGWQQHGIIPVELEIRKPNTDTIQLALGKAPDEITAKIKATGAAGFKGKSVQVTLEDGSTVAGLATVLGALAFFEVPSVILDT